MREYRGKRVDNGDWVKGSYFLDADQQKTYIIQYQVVSHYADAMFRPSVYLTEVIPESVGQYTGSKDKNGVKIYESDLTPLKHSFEHTKHTGKVTFDSKNGYGLFLEDDRGAGWGYVWFPFYKIQKDELEVIGNTTDNPKLLESEESK